MNGLLDILRNSRVSKTILCSTLPFVGASWLYISRPVRAQNSNLEMNVSSTQIQTYDVVYPFEEPSNVVESFFYNDSGQGAVRYMKLKRFLNNVRTAKALGNVYSNPISSILDELKKDHGELVQSFEQGMELTPHVPLEDITKFQETLSGYQGTNTGLNGTQLDLEPVFYQKDANGNLIKLENPDMTLAEATKLAKQISFFSEQIDNGDLDHVLEQKEGDLSLGQRFLKKFVAKLRPWKAKEIEDLEKRIEKQKIANANKPEPTPYVKKKIWTKAEMKKYEMSLSHKKHADYLAMRFAIGIKGLEGMSNREKIEILVGEMSWPDEREEVTMLYKDMLNIFSKMKHYQLNDLGDIMRGEDDSSDSEKESYSSSDNKEPISKSRRRTYRSTEKSRPVRNTQDSSTPGFYATDQNGTRKTRFDPFKDKTIKVHHGISSGNYEFEFFLNGKLNGGRQTTSSWCSGYHKPIELDLKPTNEGNGKYEFRYYQGGREAGRAIFYIGD